MRIALVTETFPPEINGVALTVQQFADELVALGHDVSIARPRQAHEARARGRDGEVLARGVALPRYPGLRIGLPSGRALREQWRVARPDAVYIATEGPLGWSALRTARRLGLPVATGFHTRFDLFVAHYGAPLLRPLALAWLRRFHNRAHATLVPTEELRDWLAQAGIPNAVRLARGVDTALFTPERRDDALRRTWGLEADDLAVIHVGRIAPEKNLDLVVQAYHAIRACVPSARMVWVGDGPALADMRRRHPDHVFCGMQRGEALARHYASGDLFVFPSLTDTFGNVVIEAMASGVPVVAYHTGAAREHLDGCEHAAPIAPGDEAAFVAAALRLAIAAQRRRQLGDWCRARVATLSPRAVAGRFAELLGALPQGSA
jgi:glycosyltransferase involved in cell wall biosynthesis